MPSHYTDVEKLLLQRWPDVRALLTAYGELQDSIEEMLTGVGEELEKWADERGYSFETDPRGAEYSMWKETWANRRNDAGVWFVVGGFVPDGYRKVKSDHPFIWVYTNPEALRIKSSLREQFVRDLRSSVGDALSEWQHPDADDSAPLGKQLTAFDGNQRLQWMTSPVSLAEFVKEAFEQLIPLVEPIDRVVKSYRQ
jgi:hypothetical protein